MINTLVVIGNMLKANMLKRTTISLILLLFTVLYLDYATISFLTEIKSNFGEYIYPLDDSYIHLSISKNLAENGIWGITKHEFSSTSSSPLFTVCIALLMKMFGNNYLLPFYFNIVISNLLLFILYYNFRNNPLQLFLLYVMFFVGVLIKIQVVSGMEHMLHIFLICSSLIYLYKWNHSNFLSKKYRLFFYLTIPFLCLARYESLFFITPIVLYLFINKRIKDGITTLLIGYIPVILFGCYSMINGGHFFPNSLLVKGEHSLSIAKLISIFLRAITIIITDLDHYLFLVIMILLVLFNNTTISKKNIIKTLRGGMVNYIVIITLLSHLMFAKTGWLFRYDAYLIGLLSITLVYNLCKIQIKKINFSVAIVSIILSFVTLYVLHERKNVAFNILSHASKNIHDQQIQMATFLKKYFDSSTVIANDIGAISYFTNIKLIDLVGLGSTDVLDQKSLGSKKFNEFINNKKYDIMMIYDDWFPNLTIVDKSKVAELIITNNNICGGDKVTLYIPNGSNRNDIILMLEKFKNEDLPKDVNLNIYY